MPISTKNFSETYRRTFTVNDSQNKIILSRLNDTAPAAIIKKIEPSPNFPLGGFVRVVPNYGRNDTAYIEVKKCTGYSPDNERMSIH